MNVETPTGIPRNNFDDHHNFIDLDKPHVNLATGVAETAKMYHALEEHLNSMEGIKTLGFNTATMCLVLGVVIPPKFKVPDFDKYKGTSFSETHLCSYCCKMAAYAENELLLMHFFQDSLTGEFLDWYMKLERTYVSTWGELADAFLKHYHYDTSMAPSLTQPLGMTHKFEVSFK